MKKTTSLFLLISMFVIVKPLFAFLDIGKSTRKALPMITAQVKGSHEDKIKGWRVAPTETTDVHIKTETIDVHIKGVDDGVKTSIQRDYKEAVLFAKREAIERAGVKVKSKTMMKDFVVYEDYIESQADAVLLAGYQIIDMGYSANGTYQVVLIGKVRVRSSETQPTDAVETSAGVVGRDGNYIKYDNGVVYDKNTGFEWYAGSDKNTNWYDAKKWVENLTVAGGGWRMPTRQELKNLYKKGAGKRNMTPLLKTTGWFVWSDETKGSSSAWGFSFGDGYKLWNPRDGSTELRGFAVRSRK